jgi:hypothetical protein
MSSRNRTVRHVAWCAAAVLVLTLLGAAEAIVGHVLVLIALVVLLPVAAFLAGRWHGLRQLRERSRYLPERLAEELAWYRRSLAELEEAAGRPLSAIIGSYRRIHDRYDDGGRS